MCSVSRRELVGAETRWTAQQNSYRTSSADNDITNAAVAAAPKVSPTPHAVQYALLRACEPIAMSMRQQVS